MKRGKVNAKKYVTNSENAERDDEKQRIDKDKALKRLEKENEALQGRLRRMRQSTKKQKQRIECHQNFITFLEEEEEENKQPTS